MATSANLVMIAVDGSTQSENAFEYYIANFHNEDSELLLVHAAEPGTLAWQKTTPNTTVPLWDHLLENDAEKISSIEEKYNNMLQRLKLKGRFVTLMSSKPGESLCKIAESEKCSLIVIGARGQGKVRRTILGSVSNYVVHHAHCPVAVCRQTGGGFCNVCGPK